MKKLNKIILSDLGDNPQLGIPVKEERDSAEKGWTESKQSELGFVELSKIKGMPAIGGRKSSREPLPLKEILQELEPSREKKGKQSNDRKGEAFPGITSPSGVNAKKLSVPELER